MSRTVTSVVEELPRWLQERVRILSSTQPYQQGEYVLYWMRTAIRTDENPALDFSFYLSNQLSIPVLVYQGLSEKYPFASDRHHTFVLQAARDVQHQFQRNEVAYAFHLEREGHRGAHLTSLANRASVVVTEDFPANPIASWTNRLARISSAPVITVDSACVVPMQIVGKAHTRAFAFRKATQKLYAQRLSRQPHAITSNITTDGLPDLPFTPVDFSSQSISDLVAACEIDHTIGPVPHTVGGSTAGYQRWHQFQDQELATYDKRRNNPLSSGVSRMSPYLHYGMVSPMRIARETAAVRNPGAEKYLDELLIWRELAYCFCFYEKNHSTLSAIPDWARQTLVVHQSDSRCALLSWESLARAQSKDDLWDAAQESLLKHGELHNNVRMTWGKALLNWTPDAKQALETIIDLNHRYALDGRDPASYGGILWCLGQFDRPFPPDRPILGTVRDRSTHTHAERLDVVKYRRQTTRPLSNTMPTVAIIGAGLSGLTCARTLHDHGFNVTVFEKSRGPAGRMATRRTDQGLQFDHGAQYFTARDKRFRRYVKSWLHDGLVERWSGKIAVTRDGEVAEEKNGTDRFVGVPGMNAVCRHLATDLSVEYNTQVHSLKRLNNRWQVTSEDGSELGSFDSVIVSAPASQAAELLAEAAQLAVTAEQVEMAPCWAVMLAVDRDFKLSYDAAFVQNSPLSWIACNSSKPGRDTLENTYVIHASPEWSEEHLELDFETAASELTEHFWKAVGTEPQNILWQVAHRWRYALPTSPTEERCLFDPELKIGACGDWCGGPRVEGAFLSGAAAAGRVMGLLTDQPNAPEPSGDRQQTLFST